MYVYICIYMYVCIYICIYNSIALGFDDKYNIKLIFILVFFNV